MGGRRRSWARLTRVLVVALALGWLPAPALAAPEDDLAAAQERANRAAAELAQAQEEIALAQDAVASVQTRVATVEARVDGTRAQVRDLAIRLYVGGSTPMLRILAMADANDVILAQQYSHVVVGASMDALEQYRSDREDLQRELADLERQQEAHAVSVEAHRARQADVMEELDRLTEVVAQATAAREAERQDAERRAAASAAAGPSAQSTAGQSTVGPLTATPTPTPNAASPATTAPPTITTPPAADADAVDPAGADWLCPVQGPHAFSDDYGAPRGGGFSHQGNDILAARGTPVVASVDGVVRHREGAVSGLAYYLDGDDGNEYFGAHLDSFGASGRVTQGTVVGRVGNTGDAASTSPHLHFEIHPGGSGYENPYPTLTRYC